MRSSCLMKAQSAVLSTWRSLLIVDAALKATAIMCHFGRTARGRACRSITAGTLACGLALAPLKSLESKDRLWKRAFTATAATTTGATSLPCHSSPSLRSASFPFTKLSLPPCPVCPSCSSSSTAYTSNSRPLIPSANYSPCISKH